MFFHIHKWSLPANGTQICEKCHKVEVVPCSHKWECPKEEMQICSKCGEARKVLANAEKCPPHKWSELRDNRQFCEKCGEVKEVKCTQHVWKEVDVSYVGATRDGSGNIIRYRMKKVRLSCKNCGEQTLREFE